MKQKIISMTVWGFLIGIMLISFSSAVLEKVTPIELSKGEAYTFDKVEVAYNPIWEKYSPISISDNWDVPLLSSVKLEGYLDKHTESCSNYCESKMVLKIYERGALIDNIRFLRQLEDESWINGNVRSYKIYIKTGEKVEEVNDYECYGTGEYDSLGIEQQSCDRIIGTHIEMKEMWEEYNLGEIVDPGVYTIKIEGEKRADWAYDWQIETQGKWLEDWAVWGIQPTVVEAHGLSVAGNAPTATFQGTRIYVKTNVTLLKVTAPIGMDAGQCIVENQSQHIVATGNFTNQNCTLNHPLLAGWFYYIGANNTNGSTYNSKYQAVGTTYVAGTYINWSGGIDITSDQTNARNVIMLDVAPQGSNVTINFPPQSYTPTTTNVQFNCTANIVGSTFKNWSLWTNKTGTFAPSNSTTTNGGNLSLSFNEGNYLWTCQACDNDGDCGFATENRTVIVTNPNPLFGLCGSTSSLIYPIVNYTFKDSSTLATLTAYVISSFNYSSTTNTTNATYTYNSGTEFASFAFCGSHQTTTYTYYPTIQYNSAGYTLTNYNGGKHVNGSSVYNLTLNLTSLADSAYQQFYVVNILGSPIEGATITASTATEGVVATGTTDSGGLLALFLDPTKVHTVLTTKEGYPNNTRTVNPSDTNIVTITLGDVNTYVPPTLTERPISGINYLFYPRENLFNGTTYAFKFYFNNSYYDVSSWGFVLYNSTNDIVGNANGVGDSGTATTNLNVGNNTMIKIIANWTVNGTTEYRTYTWKITNTGSTQYSIWAVRNRLISYLDTDEGIFGLTLGSFSLNLICFIIIFFIVGIFSYKFGLDDPKYVLVFLLTIVTLFEYGLGILDIGNFKASWAIAILTIFVFVGDSLR